jgi:2-oxo-4-hydroxy-4-carboxy-5-ureidoimidazoline decarboxylase
MSLDKINTASLEQVYQLFESCCCAPNWIESMISQRPFHDQATLFNASEKSFLSLKEEDYLTAFLGHPQIGNLETLAKKYANTSSTAGHEQSGMSAADKSILEEMQQLNIDYLQKFGFIFIVCASGKSASEMLDLIKSRINNDRQRELIIAGQEQAKITQIRLEKLL